MNNGVYLDWAATAKPDDEEILKATKTSFLYFANPSAVHSLGGRVKPLLDQAREDIANAINTTSECIYFTSGGTESNHIPMLSILSKPNFRECSIAISAIEHSAVRKQAEVLRKMEVEVLTIPANKNGVITPENVLATIRENTVFVSVMTVNNETGVVQPIAEISKALNTMAKRKIHFHTDAVQAVGKVLVDVKNTNVDSLAMAGHKIGAVRGIGFLYLKKPIESFLQGGGQEKNIRPGTENILGILSLAGCIKKACTNLELHISNSVSLMNYLISQLKQIPNVYTIPSDRVEEVGPKCNFSPYVLQITNTKIAGAVLLRSLSDKNIYVSSGSACSSKKITRPVLDAMQVPSELQQNTIRISIGPSTTKDEINEFLEGFKSVMKELE